MEKNIKLIINGIIILTLIGLLIFVSFDVSGPGSLIGGLTILWATIKSKIFGIKSSEERIDQIKSEHQQKREDWQKVKEEYESRFRSLKAQMEYLDYKSALVAEKINNLDDYQRQKLNEIEKSSPDELVKMINERYK
ncbi:hypothetical protein ACUNWD_00030 [Sunxiuqinia sp. A32]|uniref:hypothetical protein n=1 Tax=Sunxiuqinia sp. A32 TaxID=3461496 RepID=UPI0040457A40